MVWGNDGRFACEAERNKKFLEVIGIFAKGEVHEIDSIKCERYTALYQHDGNNLLAQGERLCIFLAYPFGFYGVGREDDDNILTLCYGVGDGLDPVVTTLQVGDIPPDIITRAFKVACEFADEVNVFA